jgi:hypothetical protein
VKVPQRDAVVEIEHQGRLIKAIVDDVKPDFDSTYWLVTLALATVDGPVRRDDQCYWITPEGRAAAGVAEVTAGVLTKIVLRWTTPS